MRKLIVANVVTLDGYYEGPGSNVMAMPMDLFFDAYNAERLRSADTLLLGRRTYDMFRGFWPSVADDPACSPVHREISRRDDEVEKIVVSDTITMADTAPWTDTTRILRRPDAHEQIADLKRGDGGDILVFGSRTLWNDLVTAGLVDELHLMVGPLVLGEGTLAFAGGKVPPFRLLDTRTVDGSDNVLIRYNAQPA
jgi:dihydrofolate reductase